MTLTQLNYIITIAETKSLNQAAGQLYVSQPSLTGAVRELEKELGNHPVSPQRTGRDADRGRGGVSAVRQAALRAVRDGSWRKYGKNVLLRKKFGVSTQHYSFAVKAFRGHGEGV